jgi:hypothetical protein
VSGIFLRSQCPQKSAFALGRLESSWSVQFKRSDAGRNDDERITGHCEVSPAADGLRIQCQRWDFAVNMFRQSTVRPEYQGELNGVLDWDVSDSWSASSGWLIVTSRLLVARPNAAPPLSPFHAEMFKAISNPLNSSGEYCRCGS